MKSKRSRERNEQGPNVPEAGHYVRGSESNLSASYHRFMAEADPGRKSEAGKDLVRAIFGENAISV